MATHRHMSPRLKLALDFGPLLVFFIATARFGLLTATAVVMAAVLAALAIGYAIERKLATVPLVTAGMLLFFGALTLWFADATFIKMKPTIVYCLFAAVLLGGLAMNRLFIKLLLEQTVQLPDHAWRVLTWRWAVFFLCLAAANEYVWRNFSDETWVGFKLALSAIAFVFAMAQTPFLMRHQTEENREGTQ
jgi:intracellular septation protein